MQNISEASVQVNLINSSVFFYSPKFYSHKVRFAESTPNHTRVCYTGEEKATDNTGLGDITSLEISLSELESGYQVLKPIPVRIQKSDDSFIASFNLANIHASGDTWDEAALNLKSFLLDMYDSLLSERPTALGLDPRHQLSILQMFIKKTEDAD